MNSTPRTLPSSEEIHKVLDALSDCDAVDDLFYNERMYVNCNDAFAWGCSDCEPVGVDDIPAFKQAHEDSKKHQGTLLYVSRRRKSRPQGAMYAYIDPSEWHLFDACGPPRESCFGNPIGTEDREAYYERKKKELEAKMKEEETEIASLKDALEESRLRHREAAAQWAETKGNLEAQIKESNQASEGLHTLLNNIGDTLLIRGIPGGKPMDERVIQLAQQIDRMCEELAKAVTYWEKVDERRKQALMTYGGGYHDPKELEIFHHGIETVYNLQKATAEQILPEIKQALQP